MPERLTLVLSEARDTVRQQHADLQGVRTNSANLLSASGVVAGLLASIALREDAPLTPWTFVSLGAFAVVAALVLFVQFPRKLVFSNDAHVLLGEEWQIDKRDDVETTRYLAGYLADNTARNQETIKWLFRAYATGLPVFAVQIGTLFADLATR